MDIGKIKWYLPYLVSGEIYLDLSDLGSNLFKSDKGSAFFCGRLELPN